MLRTWTSDWKERLRSVLQEMGHADAYDFVLSHPQKSFGELFGILRDVAIKFQVDLAFVQVPELFYIDAKERGHLADAFRESLIRSLRQFQRKGWNRGRNVQERRLQARVHWPTPSDDYEKWSGWQDRVWSELESLSPSDDWCPETSNDPLIREVFARVLRKCPPSGSDPASN